MTAVQVTMPDAWLTDVADPTVSVRGVFAERKSSVVATGSIRTYAGGRVRVITTPARTRTYPLTLQLLTDADLATISGWIGHVVLLRDCEGRRVFGSYLQVDPTDRFVSPVTLHDVALTFTEVTYVEGV